MDYAFNICAADFCLILNPDTVIDRNALHALFKRHQETNSGLIGSKILYYYDKSLIQSIGGKFNKWLVTMRQIALMEKDVGRCDNDTIIENPLESIIKYLDTYDMVVPKHFLKDCVYEEAKECIILGKSKFKKTINQIRKYKKCSFPKNFGIGENGIILRNHNKNNIITIMNEWWNELNIETKRDQLSLAYVLWRNDCKFNFMKETARNSNNYFEYEKHMSEKNITLMEKVKKKW